MCFFNERICSGYTEVGKMFFPEKDDKIIPFYGMSLGFPVCAFMFYLLLEALFNGDLKGFLFLAEIHFTA